MKKVTYAEALGLGFSVDQLNNAQPYESYRLRPDARLKEDFDVTEYFITDNVNIFYLECVVLQDDVKILVTRNENSKPKGKYILTEYDRILSYAECRELDLDDSNIIAYNKKKLTIKIEEFAREIKKAYAKIESAKNFYEKTKAELEQKGFSVNGNKAYKRTDTLSIDVEIGESRIHLKSVLPTKPIESVEALDKLLTL